MTTNFGVGLKLIIVGNSYTGKTSFVRRWTGGHFSNSYKATIVSDYSYKIINIDNTIYRVQLWDIAGQDKNVYITKTLGKDCFGAIVLCEAKSEDSLKATSNWKTIIDEQITFFDLCPLPVFLIENKSDLYEDDNASDEKLKQFSEENNFDNYFRVSAKTGKNMNEAMNEILAKIVQKTKEYGGKFEKKEERDKKDKLKVNLTQDKQILEDKSKKCC